MLKNNFSFSSRFWTSSKIQPLFLSSSTETLVLGSCNFQTRYMFVLIKHKHFPMLQMV